MTYVKIQGVLIFLLFLIDSIWIISSSLEVIYNTSLYIKYMGVTAFLYLVYLFYTKIRYDARIGLLFITTIYLIIFTAVALPLSYLAYTIPNPLMDSTLITADVHLGFNFPALHTWFLHHDHWNIFFNIIYNSMIFQIIFIFLYFGFFGEEIYLQRFLMLFMISILPTILLGCYYPAVGPHIWLHYPPPDFLGKAINFLLQLRKGVLDLTQGHGIIEFPSFHTTLALIFLYSFRNENKFLFLFFIILNLLMVFSTLIQGGHYLIDILGGLYIFLLTLAIEKVVYLSVMKYGTLDFLPSRQILFLKKVRGLSDV
ncbi:MAG: phosphatase PAP2 family protein [Alphaproteobacteria bacterium]|nr:phosphatase PAP2 family protein [Alphaproteobacteria bacterium]